MTNNKKEYNFWKPLILGFLAGVVFYTVFGINVILSLWGFAISTSWIALVFAIFLGPVVLMIYLTDKNK